MAKELRRVTFRVPICSICQKEVDKIEMKRELGKVKLVGYCHGDVSESPWLDEDKMDMLYTYRAFLDPRRLSDEGREKQPKNPRDYYG